METHVVGNYEELSEVIDLNDEYHVDRSFIHEIRIDAVTITEQSIVVEQEVDYSVDHTCNNRSYTKFVYELFVVRETEEHQSLTR